MAWFDPIADPDGEATLAVHVTGDVLVGEVIGRLHVAMRDTGENAVELWIDSTIIGVCSAETIDDLVDDRYRFGESELGIPLAAEQPPAPIAFECPNCKRRVFVFSRSLSICLRDHDGKPVQMVEVPV